MNSNGANDDRYKHRWIFQISPGSFEKRKQVHEAINKAALDFANIIFANVEESSLKMQAIMMIQQARMFGNQGATIDELRALEASNNRNIPKG